MNRAIARALRLPSRHAVLRAIAIVEITAVIPLLVLWVVGLSWRGIFSTGLTTGSQAVNWVGLSLAGAGLLGAWSLWRDLPLLWLRHLPLVVLAALYVGAIQLGVSRWDTLWPIPRSFTPVAHHAVTIEIPDFVPSAAAAVPRLLSDVDAVIRRGGFAPGSRILRIRLDPQPEREPYPTYCDYGCRVGDLIVVAVDTRGLGNAWGEDGRLAREWRSHVASTLIHARGEVVSADVAAGYAHWTAHPPAGSWATTLRHHCMTYVLGPSHARVQHYGSQNAQMAAIPFMRAEEVGGESAARRLYEEIRQGHWNDAAYGPVVENAACSDRR